MKLRLACHQCLWDEIDKNKDKVPQYIPEYPYWEYPTIEIDKWPYVDYICQKGHEQGVILSVELYELLFQQATYCIMDGYYREAIGTYHAALERFFEYG